MKQYYVNKLFNQLKLLRKKRENAYGTHTDQNKIHYAHYYTRSEVVEELYLHNI